MIANLHTTSLKTGYLEGLSILLVQGMVTTGLGLYLQFTSTTNRPYTALLPNQI